MVRIPHLNDQGYTVQWNEEVDAISCQHSLQHLGRDPDSRCADLAWNKTGSIISVA